MLFNITYKKQDNKCNWHQNTEQVKPFTLLVSNVENKLKQTDFYLKYRYAKQYLFGVSYMIYRLYSNPIHVKENVLSMLYTVAQCNFTFWSKCYLTCLAQGSYKVLFPRGISRAFLCIASTRSNMPCSLCILFFLFGTTSIRFGTITSYPSFILYIIIGPAVFPESCLW